MPPSVVSAAGRGELPPWAEVSPSRREHIARVAELLSQWATALELPPAEHSRWVAVGWLHDALRDAPADRLRDQLSPGFRDLPAPLLHGPAAAERLGDEADESLRNAIRYHTIGHPSLDRLGHALYLADFLEPGRVFDVDWHAELRARMPHEMNAVLLEAVAARIRHLLEIRKPIRPETAAFWSSLVRTS